MLDTDADANTGLPPRTRKDRKLGRIILPALIVVLALTAFGLSRFYSWATGASGPRTPVVIQVPDGASGAEVATLLQKAHVIRSAFGFKILVRVKHSQPFKSGRYQLTTNMTAAEALAALELAPKLVQVRVTIPEGLDLNQEAAILATKLSFSADAFVQAATSGAFPMPGLLPSGTTTLEGFLFPNTYFFYPDATPKAVIDEQIGAVGFAKEAADLGLVEGARALGVSPFDVVIVASIIEREAKFPKDRPRVAEVIYNRLKQGMRLQLNSTVAYAVDKVGQTLAHGDFKSKSPYNTYTHDGLPAGPISNPGAAALTAALHPTQAGYLYFVLIDKLGHEAFTASYDEFLRLKAQAPQ
jgi:UPF0755 protein